LHAIFVLLFLHVAAGASKISANQDRNMPSYTDEQEPLTNRDDEWPLRCQTTRFSHKEANLIKKAGYGYDIWKSNQWMDQGESHDDPGERYPIFKMTCNEGDKVAGFLDFVHISPVHKCQTSFNKQTIKTAAQYMQKRSGKNSYKTGASVSASGGAFGITVSMSAAFAMASNSEYQALTKLFNEKHGEIAVAEAVCTKRTVTIKDQTNQEHGRPLFHRAFIAELNLIDEALRNVCNCKQIPDKCFPGTKTINNLVKSCKDGSAAKTQLELDCCSKLSENKDCAEGCEMAKGRTVSFMRNYGTHYGYETDLGATFYSERRFLSQSHSTEEQNQRQDCHSNSAKACAGVDVAGKGGVSACYNRESAKCSASENQDKFFSEEGLDESKIITIGSPLRKNPNEWAESSEDFNQVPIRRKLVLIGDLFQRKYLKKSKDYGFKTSLDANGLRAVWNKVAKNYCTLVKGASQTDCDDAKRKFIGCGYTSDCKLGEVCENDQSEKGFTCKMPPCQIATIDGQIQACKEAANKWGLVMGAYDGITELKFIDRDNGDGEKYWVKGCYAYSAGKWAGHAFFGTGDGVGGTKNDITKKWIDANTYRPGGYDCAKCVPYSEEACRDAALRHHLTLGTNGELTKSSSYSDKGCFTYLEGSYDGKVYYGTKGSTSAEKSMNLEKPKVRPFQFDCDFTTYTEKISNCEPYSMEACRQAALNWGLTLGGGGYKFTDKDYTGSTSSYLKGCYAYKSGTLKGKAFFGYGDRVNQIASNMDPGIFKKNCPDNGADGRCNAHTPTFRPGGYDCRKCIPYSWEACVDAANRRNWKINWTNKKVTNHGTPGRGKKKFPGCFGYYNYKNWSWKSWAYYGYTKQNGKDATNEDMKKPIRSFNGYRYAGRLYGADCNMDYFH